MKKLIILTLFILGISSCAEKNVTITNTEYALQNGRDLNIVIIDSCEYFYLPPADLLTHKGNCKNHK